MGLRDHLEDGTGHILSLGLDLNYLHVEGTERQAALGSAAGGGSGVAGVGAGPLSHGSSSIGSSSTSLSTRSSYSSSCSNFSDSEDERFQNGPCSEPQNPCRDQAQQETPGSARLDLVPARSPGLPETPPQSEPAADCRSKVEFALKLGYSEELVLLVLKKLGPGALINDILGELVKLGTKTEMDRGGGGGGGGGGRPHSPPSSSSLTCSSTFSLSTSSPDSCRLLCQSQLLEDKENLRPVVVDGSNVAMSHGNKEVFSCQGIQLAVDWFLDRGHRDITVFVPAWRKEQSRPDALITDQEILRRLEKEKILVFTPSRRVQGRRVVCYDDRFIVKLAYESDGIIVSNDNYRDLANEKPEWKKFIDERLLMYSFVNDKFMPPDDPLGRHGPSLENFLRKKPVIPEHRKQPCPYGKKCTYGHKCKFYHPERGSQPQRSVADELRASAKISTVVSKGQLEDSLMAKSQNFGQPEVVAEAGHSRATPKKQMNPSPLSSLTDLLEDRHQMQSKAEARRGSGGSSCSRSFLGHPAPGGPPASGSLDRYPGGNGGLGVRVGGASGPSQAESYRCESPVLGYSSLVKAYHSLSLVVPQSPERFFPADLRARSLPSDCSSEGSVSSDSFSPDPVLDDSPKCHHHHHHHHHHPHPPHHCPGQYPVSRSPPGLSQHPPSRYPLPLPHRPQHGFAVEDPPSTPPPPFKPPPAYRVPHHQHPLMSCLPPSTTHDHAPSSLMGHNLMGSLWQDSGLQDSRVYEGSPLLPRKNYSSLNQPPQHHYQQSSKSYYDPLAFQSLPDVQERTWSSPWGRHSSPRRPAAVMSLPMPQQLSLSPFAAHKPHQSPPQQQEKPSLGQYQEQREKVFVNLCGIFPPDLVRVVMTRNPHVTDAQELAAAILMEKSQHRS